MSLREKIMQSNVYALLTCLCFSVCQEEEPSYDYILYGGIWKWPVLNATIDDDDISKAVDTAVMFLEQRQSSLRKKDGNILSYTVTDIQRMKLVYTRNDQRPFLQTSRERSSTPMSTFLIFGFTYSFHLAWNHKDYSANHNFIMSMYPQGTFYIYGHTSDVINDMNSNFTNSTTAPQESQTSCGLAVEAAAGSDSNLFPTRSCTARQTDFLRNRFCESEKNLYGQFHGENIQGQCEITKRYLFNISVMTYNIWNFNSRPEGGSWYYVDRIKRLAKVIADYQPDIVALQEVRFENTKGGVLGPNQVEHLASILPGYQFIYQPAQLQPNSVREGKTEEGVAIFSRFPLLSHSYLLLFRNQSNSADLHQRICQHVEIKLPQDKTVHVFNTHFSLSHEAREESVAQIWNYMNKFEGAAILAGDLNAEPQENAIRFIREETQLIDSWHHFHGNQNSGNTFSTLNDHLTKRIDYIFLRQSKCVHLLDVEIIDDGTKGEKAASDHVPLVSTFGFT